MYQISVMKNHEIIATPKIVNPPPILSPSYYCIIIHSLDSLNMLWTPNYTFKIAIYKKIERPYLEITIIEGT